MDFETVKTEYKRHILIKFLFIGLCVAFVVIAGAISVTIGGYNMHYTRVYEIIFDHITGKQYEMYSTEWYENFIVWDNRIPKVIFAILAGIGLAVSGAAMQSIMKNPLAEPYTTGVSSGAYLGVAIAMAMGLTVIGGRLGITGNAFIFALIPVIFIIIFSSRLGDSVASIILVGTALSYLFNAFSTYILVHTDADTLAEVYKWQVGTISTLSWDELTVVAAVVITGVVIIHLLSKKLNIMAMGDNNAKSLGVNVQRLRTIIMIVMAVIIAFIVSYAGIIGFIGLICPHMIRMVIGSDNRFVIPAASAFGAAFLILADIIAKYLSSLDMIPVGVVCSFIGAPIFMIILIRNRKGIW